MQIPFTKRRMPQHYLCGKKNQSLRHMLHGSPLCWWLAGDPHRRNYTMEWLRLVGSEKLYVSFAKEPYKRDDILQKRPVITSILLTVATPYDYMA